MWHVWGREEVRIEFWWGKLLSSKTGVDMGIILKRHFKKWGGGVDCIELAQDKDRWRALLNVVMKLWFHKMPAIS